MIFIAKGDRESEPKSNQALRSGKETVIGVNGGDKSSNLAGEFSRVSEDMNELVFHLDAIQNDISELAGRPISVYDNS